MLIGLFVVIYLGNVKIAPVLQIVSLVSLSVIYYLASFMPINAENVTVVDRMVEKILGMSSSVGLISVLFFLQRWPGAVALCYVACFNLSLCFFYMMWRRNQDPDFAMFEWVTRVRALVIIGANLAVLIYK